MICRVCGGNSFKVIYKKNKFSVNRCNNCGFGSLIPLPSEYELHNLYSSQQYHSDKSLHEHLLDAQKKFSYVDRWLEPKNVILDFGCGTGAFLKTAKSAGFNSIGYDLAQYTATEASKFSGCETRFGKLNTNTYREKSLNVITAFDVIEHIIDYRVTLNFWHHWLKPSGLIFITTPNLSSWDHALFGHRWYGFTKIPQHVNYFDRLSITKVLRSAGFKILSLQTWGFCRSLPFICSHLPYGLMINKLIHAINLNNRDIYVPMIDMMLVARKMN